LPRFINSLFAIFSDKISGRGAHQANIADREENSGSVDCAVWPQSAEGPDFRLALACLCVYHEIIMTPLFSGFLLALFGLSLILITLSLRLLRGAEPVAEAYPTTARFFLIALRLAIGWHCFVEGMEKVTSPNWSSEAYLRESVGPLSEGYRWVAGDRLIAKAMLGPDDSFPSELEREWRDYFDAFAAHYQLNEQELQRAQAIFDQRKSDTLTYLRSKSETVTKVSPLPPELKVEMTMKERLEEHERLLERVRSIEAQFPTDDKDVHAQWKSAKADLAKWRADIKRSIDAQTNKLKKIDDNLKKDLLKKIDALNTKLANAKEADKPKLQKELDAEKAKLWEPLADAVSSAERLEPPLPERILAPLRSWRLLEISDFAVKWSLVILGACLLLGLFTRTSSLLLALLVLSFYLAMPPLPGWPESPRLEGHYLLINKTLIEVIALFALAFLPTGRWAGLDGLFCLCCGGKKAPAAPVSK
jgi:uncharacterized membrane protein YphA (DoxX/SURF4 family)